MNKTKESLCKGRGISLPVDLWEQVDRRVAQLHPRVKGASHYIQLLVDWDLQNGAKPQKKEQPFNHAEPQVVGLAA